MRKLITMREALRLSEYFGDALAGNSWANWRVLLIAIAGEPLDEAEVVTFKALSGRAGAPTEAAREFWAVVWPQGRKKPFHGRPGGLVSRLQRLPRHLGAG